MDNEPDMVRLWIFGFLFCGAAVAGAESSPQNERNRDLRELREDVEHFRKRAGAFRDTLNRLVARQAETQAAAIA